MVQGFVVLLGISIVVVGVWLNLDGGPARVMEVARELGRTQVTENTIPLDRSVDHLGRAAALVAGQSGVYAADQISAQRFLGATNINTARTSYFVNTLGSTFLLAGLIYGGLCLLALYHDHPRDLRPEWVVNLNGQTRQPVLDESGRPLLDPNNPDQKIVAENIDRLLAEQRMLGRTTSCRSRVLRKSLIPETDRVMIEKLMMRRPGQGRGPGEVILRGGII